MIQDKKVRKAFLSCLELSCYITSFSKDIKLHKIGGVKLLLFLMAPMVSIDKI